MNLYQTTITVEANQQKQAGQFTHDCGICRWNAGDWLVINSWIGPVVFSDADFRLKFEPVSKEEPCPRLPMT